MARRRLWVLIAWGPLLVAGAVAYVLIGQYLPPADISVTGSQSSRVAHLMAEHFAEFGSEQDLLVFDSANGTVDDPQVKAVIEDTVRRIRGEPQVRGVIGPFDALNPLAGQTISTDRKTAFAVLALRSADAHDRARDAGDLREFLHHSEFGDVDVLLTGYSPGTNDLAATEKQDTVRAEAIGLPIAGLALVLALGALVAASVPLIVAGVGLTATFGVIAVLMPTMNFSALVVTVATLLGTGLGLDYSLFLVGRFREELTRRGITDHRDHEGIAQAVGACVATAGRTITVSGLIIVTTLSALLVVDSPVFREITVGISATVLTLLAVALTALPAVLAVLGPRVNNGTIARFTRARPDTGDPGADRWVRHVMRHPLGYTLTVIAVLSVAVVPLTDLRYGLDLGTAALADTESGRANTILAEKFTPGLAGPIQLVYSGPHGQGLDAAGRTTVYEFADTVRADPRVSGAFLQTSSDGLVLQVVVPAVAPDSAAAIELVSELRAYAPSGAQPVEVTVGGTTAVFLDLAEETESKTPLVIALVVVLSLLLLVWAFRSLALPVKAVAINLLVTCAAVGTAVAVFQWGWAERVFGFTSPGYLQVYLPVTVFCVLFGLSMDYQVFLLDRIREEYRAAPASLTPADRNQVAVVAGVAHTARPILAAATVMVVILLAMLTADVLELKQFGFTIALAILLDALAVRLMLVPAVMKLLGAWNWWPGTRVLPARADDPDRQSNQLARVRP